MRCPHLTESWLEMTTDHEMRLEGVRLLEENDRLLAYVQKLEIVEKAARRFIKEGLRLTPDGLIVRENADKSDPHYALWKALELIAPLNSISENPIASTLREVP